MFLSTQPDLATKQRRWLSNTAQFVLNDYSLYSIVFQALQWPSLEHKHAYPKLLLIYKIKKSQVDPQL